MKISNPLFSREIKRRMRSLRGPIVLTVYLAILAAVVFTTERSMSRDAGFGDPFASAVIGRTVFHYILFFMLMMVCFLVPGFVAGSFTTEREQRTLSLLQVTLMKPRTIVLGKLASSMSFLMLLIVATVPLVSISFILGGVSPLDVLRGFAMVIFTGLTFALVGIGMSANLKRTVSATVLTYGLVATLTIGTVITYGLAVLMAERNRPNFGQERKHVYTLVLNPFVGTASAIQGRDSGSFQQRSPFDALFSFLAAQPDTLLRARAGAGGVAIEDLPLRIQPELQQPRSGGVPVWVSTVGWYTGLGVLGYLLAVAGIRAPTAGIGFGRRRISIGDV